MGTSAIIGLRQDAGGWRGRYVRYDGYPSELGRTILNLVVDLDGDLSRVWQRVDSAPDGWLHPFSERYESGENDQAFRAIGCAAPPLLTDEDAFARQEVAFWYVFDLIARKLSIYEPPTPPPSIDRGDDEAITQWYEQERPTAAWILVEEIVFQQDGSVLFDNGPASSGDWRNRRAHYGHDNVEATAASLATILSNRLPIEGQRVDLAIPGGQKPHLTPIGLKVPLIAFVRDRSGDLAEILQDDQFILYPLRVLTDRRRCQLALQCALDTIEECIWEARQIPEPGMLFAAWALDLRFEESELRAFVSRAIRESFEA